jgi:glucose/mannose-6-phosphate isomerase
LSALDFVRDVDPSGQLDDVLALPEHLRDALWRVESAEIAERQASGLVVCGMGGSAIGGDLARAALGDRLTQPLETVRGYAPSPVTPPDRLVLCSSYSGDTEETVACYEAAAALGAPRIVVSTGGALTEAARRDGVPVIGLPAGLQPRVAVGYMFVAAAEVVRIAGAGGSLRSEIDFAAAHLERDREALCERAAEIARRLAGSVPVIAGCGLTAPVAYRWKTEVNEMAKSPAFSHQVPELDHNEIVGWEGASPGGGGAFAAVFLTDCDQHPRVRRRFELTAELIEPHAAEVVTVETVGETRTERLLWAVALGDLVSLGLAGLRGVDPGPVAMIEKLKDRLGRP